MDTAPFSDRKRAIFSKVKKIKRLRGGVAVYAAQASMQIDAEIGGKGRFLMKTSSQKETVMALPWKILDRFDTQDEGILELRQRGKGDYLITVGPQVLMNSKAQRSEIALGELGCKGLLNQPNPKVLVGGLGMAITLRAVLDVLPKSAQVVVAELNPKIHEWCLGPLAELTDGAASDPRVTVEIADVTELIQQSPSETFDAVILDLYRGPHPKTDKRNDPIYGSRAIERTRAAIKPAGTFAIWGENPDAGFERRLAAAGFTVRCERHGKGGYRHAVWIAKKGKTQTQPNRRQ